MFKSKKEYNIISKRAIKYISSSKEAKIGSVANSKKIDISPPKQKSNKTPTNKKFQAPGKTL